MGSLAVGVSLVGLEGPTVTKVMAIRAQDITKITD
jgi:hypothetical protein